MAEENADGTDGDQDECVVLWGPGTETNETPNMNQDLSVCQQEEVRQLLAEFKHVLRNKPGKTNAVEYRIWTSATPIRLPPYRLPHAYRDAVKQELEEMESDGVIERSHSEWAFPIVLVPKKDGTLRMRVDYRRLNAVTEADAYPMPRVDDLIDSLGKAKYLTPLTLREGFGRCRCRKTPDPTLHSRLRMDCSNLK